MIEIIVHIREISVLQVVVAGINNEPSSIAITNHDLLKWLISDEVLRNFESLIGFQPRRTINFLSWLPGKDDTTNIAEASLRLSD